MDPLFPVDAVDAAVEHLIEVVGFPEGDQRDDHVAEDSGHHGDEEDLHGVDRKLERIHLPDNVGGEGRADRLKHVIDRFAVAEPVQPRVDAFRPVLLHDDAADRNRRAAEQRGERARGRTEPAVETADHHRSGAAAPDAGHDREEHVDIVHLGEKDRAAEEEDRHPQREKPQIPEVFIRGERFFLERHDDILHDGGGGVEDARIVGREHQHDHQQGDQPDHTARQNVAQHHRHHHLIVERAESLIGRVAVLLGGQDVGGLAEIAGVGVVRAGEFLSFREDDLRLGGEGGHHLVAYDVVFDGFGGDLGGEFVADRLRLRGEILVGHQRDHADGDDHAHEETEAVPPGADDAGHLLFVWTFSAAAGVVADPAGAVEDVVGDGDDQGEEVEVAELIDVIWIEETFSLDAVGHDRSDLHGPGEFAEDEEDEDHENRIADQPLEAVGDDQRNPSGRPDHHHREDETEDQHQHEGGDGDAEHVDRVRQTEKVDEEPGRDGGADRVGEHFGDGPERGGEDAEGAVVAQFEELTHRHRLGFAETVETVSGERGDQRDGDDDVVPEVECETALILLFDHGDDGDDAQH